MEYHLVEVLDNDENGIVELVENEKGQRYIRRIMQGKVEVYLALKQISHKFIPEIVYAEFDGKQTVTIEEYINSKGDLTCLKNEHELVSAFCELCEVLEFIHAREIIHRDIKPSNVLIADDGHICLIDFDAARRYKEESSNDTRYLGTRGYAAPEQFGFTQTDPTADIYALGVTMKNAMGKLAGTRKYKGIIRKCTEFDPENRYRSASAVRTNLLFGEKRYYLEAGAVVLVCAAIILGAGLIRNIHNSNAESVQAIADVTESVSETIYTTASEEKISEATTSVTTTIPETTTVSTTSATTIVPETTSETTPVTTTTSATTTSATTTTVPITETEVGTEISFSVPEAYDISEEGFELISPRNEKLVPKVASEEIAEGLYNDYFVDEFRFVDDRNIRGRWETVALMDTFDPKLIKKYFLSGDEGHVKSPEIGHIQEIEFGDYGQCFSYYNTYANISEWTHGVITNDYFIYYKNISGYYIFRIDGVDYLFVEGKLNDGDLKDDGVAQSCVVFKKFIKDEEKNTVTTKAAETEKQMIKMELISPTDESKLAKFEKRLAEDGNYYDFYDDEYKFVSDSKIIGEWVAIDYTENVKNWIYDSNKSTDGLWLKNIKFNSDGSCIPYSEGFSEGALWKWTYGQVIIIEYSNYFVNRYYLYSIDGKEFLFVEFKNGDYMNNEFHTPGWYIFKKV